MKAFRNESPRIPKARSRGRSINQIRTENPSRKMPIRSRASGTNMSPKSRVPITTPAPDCTDAGTTMCGTR
ncbi:hypothetical protein DSECCO2_429930 [anaerobic digester metagenome]